MVIGNAAIPRQKIEEEIKKLIEEAVASLHVNGRRILVIIPDTTRHAELPVFFRILGEALGPQVKALDYLIATGTHHPLDMTAIFRHVGITDEEYRSKYAKTKFFNHSHNDPSQLRTIGKITASEMSELSEGLFTDAVDITINKCIFDYDQIIVISPVVLHETVGFAGGNKYFFPGIGGEKIIETFHWIGALITNPVVNGVKDTPVRRVINKAASMISGTAALLCVRRRRPRRDVAFHRFARGGVGEGGRYLVKDPHQICRPPIQAGSRHRTSNL